MKPGQVKEESKLSIGPQKAKDYLGADLKGRVPERQWQFGLWELSFIEETGRGEMHLVKVP